MTAHSRDAEAGGTSLLAVGPSRVGCCVTSGVGMVASWAAWATAGQGRVSPLTATFQPLELSRAMPKACAQCCTGKDSSLVRPRLSRAASKAAHAAPCSPPCACSAEISEQATRAEDISVALSGLSWDNCCCADSGVVASEGSSSRDCVLCALHEKALQHGRLVDRSRRIPKVQMQQPLHNGVWTWSLRGVHISWSYWTAEGPARRQRMCRRSQRSGTP